MDAGCRCRGERAMAEIHKIRAARVTCACILEDFFRFQIEESQAERMNLLPFGDAFDLLPDAVPDVFRGHGLQRVERGPLFRINTERAGEFIVLYQTDCDVFHYEYADRFGHRRRFTSAYSGR